MAGTSLDPLCNNTDTRSSHPNHEWNYTDRRSSQPNQASRTPDFSFSLISSESFPSSSPISLFLLHNSTIIAEHRVKSSRSISPCHDDELTLCTSTHRVQHTPCTASNQDCLSSLHSHNYELTPQCTFNLRRASLQDQPPSAGSPWEVKGKVSLSHSHGYMLTTRWKASQHPAPRPLTASKYWSKLSRLRPPSSHNHGRQMHLSKLARSQPPSASPNSLNKASKCISKLAWLWPWSSHDHGRKVYLCNTGRSTRSPNQ